MREVEEGFWNQLWKEKCLRRILGIALILAIVIVPSPLPISIRNATSIECFKSSLKCVLFNSPN